MSTMQLHKETWNMTVDEFKEHKKDQKQAEDFLTSTTMPNGVYRAIIQIFTDKDPVGFAVQYQSERYLRLNDENF